jgi:hypothetical protein
LLSSDSWYVEKNAKSEVWKVFFKNKHKKDVAKCRACGTVVNCSGGSTSALKNHYTLGGCKEDCM